MEEGVKWREKTFNVCAPRLPRPLREPTRVMRSSQAQLEVSSPQTRWAGCSVLMGKGTRGSDPVFWGTGHAPKASGTTG